MNVSAALDWLFSTQFFGIKLGLDNTGKLLAAADADRTDATVVHVAGTNGKGSTCAMIEALARAQGYVTGLFTSPHLVEFSERIRVNGNMIPPEALAEEIFFLKQLAEGWEQPPTFFELALAVALRHFRKSGVNFIILETGLGGRLDATNAVDNTLVACIMAIGKDHTELLGHTYAGIAAEKCGIFKPGCSVVAYPAQPEEAMRQIEACAAAAHCPLCVPQLEDFHFYRGRPFENRVNYGGYDLEVPFAGRHQAYNAAVMVQAALALCEHGFDISDDAIMQGIAAARNPARIEVLQRRPLVILDGMHNPDGARALADVLRAGRVQGLTAVMGVLQGKGEAEMLRALSPHLARVYAVQPPSPRALPAGQLAAAARQVCGQVSVWQDVPLAVQDALRTCQGGVLICGSLYLAAQVRPMFLP